VDLLVHLEAFNVCGIAGYIGNSFDPKLSFQIATKLFEKLEIRGIDASGYWGNQTGEDGSILIHKEPTRSSSFITSSAWLRLQNYNLDLMLLHSRKATKNSGPPSINSNNHPFLSDNKALAMIHNGKLDDSEHAYLRAKYEVKSTCDSELILRIIERSEGYCLSTASNSKRLYGIMNAYSQLARSHMAVALAEKEKNNKSSLWLFRNEHRPLWVIDLRNLLGQVFFVSEKNIWEESIEQIDFNIFKHHKIMELPPYQIWYFEQNLKIEFKKYCVENVGLKEVTFDGNKISITKNQNIFQVITDLAEDESVQKSINYAEIIDKLSNLDDVYKIEKIFEIIKDNKLL
jgi:glucosamine 6-phosphate synthetase-like amidotransferase/phosphosugar isomerase protein